jgi:hypothetical protein
MTKVYAQPFFSWPVTDWASDPPTRPTRIHERSPIAAQHRFASWVWNQFLANRAKCLDFPAWHFQPRHRGALRDFAPLGIAVRRAVAFVCWCGRQELNLHIFRYQLLRLARLPIPPRPQGMTATTLTAPNDCADAISLQTPIWHQQLCPKLRNYAFPGTYPDQYGFARHQRFNRHDSRRRRI